MGILLFIIFGALVGWVASMIMESRGGLLWDICIGIIGALIGGLIMGLVGGDGIQGFTLYSFLVAVMGSCVLIFIVRVLQRQ